MTLEEISALLAANKATFPFAYKDIKDDESDYLLNVWANLFESYETKLIQHAFYSALKGSKFPITPADIFEQLGKMKAATESSEEELWQVFLTAAIRAYRLSLDFTYSFRDEDGVTQGEKARQEAERLFKELPREVQSFCTSLSQLIGYGAIEQDELLQYVKPNFLRRVVYLRERNNVIDNTPREVLELIGGEIRLERQLVED